MPRRSLGSNFENGRPISEEAGKLRTPQEELAYLREQVRQREAALETTPNQFEHSRITKREIQEYGDVPAPTILHETVVMPDHEIIRHKLKLEPETHDTQVDEILRLAIERGIRNALSIVHRLNNPHLEDDVHRALIRYVAEGLPEKGIAAGAKVQRALHLALLEIQPQAAGAGEEMRQQKLELVLASSEQLYAGLMALVSRDEGFSLEIAVPEGSEEASLYLAIPSEKKAFAERLVASVFPGSRVLESRGDYNIFNYEGSHAAAYAKLAAHPAFPLKTGEQFEHDPMNLTLAAFAKIAKHGEGAALQIVVGNEGDRYNRHYQKMLRELERGKPVHEAVKVAETAIGEALHEFGKAVFTEPKNEAPKQDRNSLAEEAISGKIKSRIAPTVIRLVASAKDAKRAQDILNNLEAPLAQYDDPRGNHFTFKRIGSWGLSNFLRDFTYRSFEQSIALPLSLNEISALVHFTAERVTTSRELKRSTAKQAAAPVEAAGSEGIMLGSNHYGAEARPVRFDAQDRLRHCYVIGQTGTGKTGLLKNMIIQDIQNGEGVAFIDPHGSDIEDVLASIPPERAGDVIYFDPAHTERPMGLNMLEYDRSRPELKTFVVDEVYGMFRKLYQDVPEAFGPMFEQYYRNAVQLVVEDPETGSTFLEIPRVFADSTFRALKLSRCKNPVLVQFWNRIAAEAGGDVSLESVAPYVTSKFDVFLTNDIMRPIVAQEKSAFNFREIMDSKKIFLANLAKGRLGERNASLLGLILVSKFAQAAFSRVDTREEVPPYYLYIDEFQNFATPSLTTILSEARKYKLALTVAHQFIAQLDEHIRDAVVGNVGTKIALRVGTSDAEFLEKQFAPVFTAQDLENLPNRSGVAALLVNGSPARPFTLETADLPAFDYRGIDALKEFSYQSYGVSREEVESMIRAKYAQPKPVDVGLPSPYFQ